MKAWKAVVLPCWLVSVPSPAGQPPASALRRPGETVILSFHTARGKTAVLCEGPKGAYLVYRFGTPVNVELQYPAVLNASSWRKFTYFSYHRIASPPREDYRLSFSNGKTTYELYDSMEAITGKSGYEEYPHEVGIRIELPKGRSVTLIGKVASTQGTLELDEAQRARVKKEGGE